MVAVFEPRLRRLVISLTLAVGLVAVRPALADEPTSDTAAAELPAVAGVQTLALQGVAMQGVVDRALGYLGVPYRFGGNNPQSGFDCSGLVTHVYRETLGMVLPRTARQLATVGSAVSREDLRPGDLVFFNTRGAPNSHVGIYLGDSRFIHAPRARTLVRIDRIDDPGYRNRYEGARRLDPLELVISSADPRR